MSLEKYHLNIKKTGFDLEFRISEILRKAGWSTINNKYYIDDVKEEVREIDIIAYKVTDTKDIRIFTTLVISCKKSEKNLWALLSKKLDEKDPNLELKPVHVCSNNKVLGFITSMTEFKNNYYENIINQKVGRALCTPRFQIFAYQEMEIDSGNPKNDTAIFNSISSLMKAQSYEINSLPKRRIGEKLNYIYQFNLVSIIDSKLLRILFEEKNINTFEIDEDNYIARYIINKEQTIARVHFVKAEAFGDILEEYNLYHLANCNFFQQKYDEFYIDVISNEDKLKILFDEFYDLIKTSLYFELLQYGYKKTFDDFVKDVRADINWDEVSKSIIISLDIAKKFIDFLNENKTIRSLVAINLNTVYRYDGRFEFVDVSEVLNVKKNPIKIAQNMVVLG
ncbi:hypothetical protein [Nostoc sp. TCL240-02]|uniref:hypothetical protein n=1 Tax=Nostoc sp. TCL240-02 TaxID=2572090 RepID=UPI00157FAFDB|nr:hypothetical protein [Nostoc sp. TCL240-02]QKQ76725.1 hypothetical protein FBB35_28580 [Nostoc sp. TCL240-02]